eukprot:3815098-Pyramimonas_sp.AAC.1
MKHGREGLLHSFQISTRKTPRKVKPNVHFNEHSRYLYITLEGRRARVQIATVESITAFERTHLARA